MPRANPGLEGTTPLVLRKSALGKADAGVLTKVPAA